MGVYILSTFDAIAVSVVICIHVDIIIIVLEYTYMYLNNASFHAVLSECASSITTNDESLCDYLSLSQS